MFEELTKTKKMHETQLTFSFSTLLYLMDCLATEAPLHRLLCHPDSSASYAILVLDSLKMGETGGSNLGKARKPEESAYKGVLLHICATEHIPG